MRREFRIEGGRTGGCGGAGGAVRYGECPWSLLTRTSTRNVTMDWSAAMKRSRHNTMRSLKRSLTKLTGKVAGAVSTYGEDPRANHRV